MQEKSNFILQYITFIPSNTTHYTILFNTISTPYAHTQLHSTLYNKTKHLVIS